MAALRVPVFYDFASTICYVAHRVMERMAADLDEFGIALDWTPIDLTAVTGWQRGAPVDGPRRENALRVASELGVAVRMPGHWMDSRAANAVALALSGSDRAPAWRERVFSAVFEEGRLLDDAGTVAALGRDLGLDAAALSGDAQLDALDDATERARHAEVTGVPTFLLGAYPFGGIQEEATMRSLLGRWAKKARADSAAESAP